MRADPNGNLVAGEALGVVSIGPAAFQGAFPWETKHHWVTEHQASGVPFVPVPLIAHVQLPQGAGLIGVVFNYWDNSGIDRLRLSLRQRHNRSAALSIVASFVTSGAQSSLRQTAVPIDPLRSVDNFTNYYYIHAVAEIDDGSTTRQAGWDDMVGSFAASRSTTRCPRKAELRVAAFAGGLRTRG